MRLRQGLLAAAWALVPLSAQELDRALAAIAANDTPAAERELEALSRARPGHPEIALARGAYLLQLGKFLEAREALAPVASDPRGETLLLLARASTGECAAVLPPLIRHFQTSGNERLRRLAGLGAVQCAIATGDLEAVSTALAQLRKMYPDDPDTLFLAARFHLKSWNEVIFALFQKAPASYRVNQISAEIFEIQGNYAAAAAEYRKAIEKNPRALNLHYRLGRALLLDSHEPAVLEQARREFERELEINPNDAAAEYQLAQILVAQQKPELARPRLERALELNPSLAEAAVALGRLHLQAQDPARAIPLLERAVRLAPASEPARYQLMLAYRNAGRHAEAEREKAELEKLQKAPEGEFSEFLKRLGEKRPAQERP